MSGLVITADDAGLHRPHVNAFYYGPMVRTLGHHPGTWMQVPEEHLDPASFMTGLNRKSIQVGSKTPHCAVPRPCPGTNITKWDGWMDGFVASAWERRGNGMLQQIPSPPCCRLAPESPSECWFNW